MNSAQKRMVNNQVEFYRLCAMRGGLKLESLGMKRGKGPSIYSMVKQEFGFKGNIPSVYAQFCEYVEKERGRYGFDNPNAVRDDSIS